LQIPKSDRRSRRRRPATLASWQQLAGTTLLIIVVAAGAATLATPQTLRGAKIEERVAAWKTKALIAAGFGIGQVSVTGQRYTLDSDVFDALDLPNVKTFDDLDAAAALKRIERLPWVDTAQITRMYPSTMAVQIRERTPYALWKREDRTFLIDVTGRVLGPVAANQTWVLPLVSGEGAKDEAASLLAALNRHPDVQNLFDHAERISSRRWSVVLKNGSRIELGADRDDEGLAQIIVNSTLRRALSGPPVVIDVRTPGRLALRPMAGNTSALLGSDAASGRVAAVTAGAQ
jgi:cell division protein FtsQ